MGAASALSFSALAGPGGAESCLAYWLGECEISGLPADAAGVAAAMSYQYDTEEQAGGTGYVLAPDADWREHFTPVAPVQLTRAWSPLPRAIEILGEPEWASVEPDVLGTCAAACAWRSPGTRQPSATPAADPDHERFRRLLAVTVMRARSAGRGVLIAAKPGWSYDHACQLSAATRRLMDHAGFAVTDRHG